MHTHPESAEQTYAKQTEINELWTQLTAKANSRKEKLLDSYDLQRFLNDHRDLLAWINSMMGLVSSEELANDVTGAEALIERHQVIMSLFFPSHESTNRNSFGFCLHVVLHFRITKQKYVHVTGFPRYYLSTRVLFLFFSFFSFSVYLTRIFQLWQRTNHRRCYWQLNE